MMNETQKNTIMDAVEKGDFVALKKSISELPPEIESEQYVEVDWTVEYDQSTKQLEVNWNAKVKVEGGFISGSWCQLSKAGNSIAWRLSLRNNLIQVTKQGDNHGWIGLFYVPSGQETISAQVGGWINAPGIPTKFYIFDKTITIG